MSASPPADRTLPERIRRVRRFVREVRRYGWAPVKKAALNLLGLSLLAAGLFAAGSDPLAVIAAVAFAAFLVSVIGAYRAWDAQELRATAAEGERAIALMERDDALAKCDQLRTAAPTINATAVSQHGPSRFDNSGDIRTIVGAAGSVSQYLESGVLNPPEGPSGGEDRDDGAAKQKDD